MITRIALAECCMLDLCPGADLIPVRSPKRSTLQSPSIDLLAKRWASRHRELLAASVGVIEMSNDCLFVEESKNLKHSPKPPKHGGIGLLAAGTEA
ncbi:hypothetical protein ZHAS_00011881 [Anopheles sinensis]|uniref:Uncharacterized protein n=1 Tax=Anopheles sinensis TaxID=74873 RepID=A0A084W1F6_ANOSI|nr:hypothetical protein ZHAS_00011881 [Anopheles sinensis]